MLGLAGLVGAAAPAGALTVGSPGGTRPDLAFTVVSTSPVYAPVDGTSVVFAELRNDDQTTTLSVGRAFAVTFYDSVGNVLGVVTGAATLGSPASLGTGLRAVPPGQLGDVSATLPGVVAASARITDAAASGSPYADARLPISSLPARSAQSATSDAVGVTAVNTTGFPARLHVVVAAEDAGGRVLGIVAAPPGDPEPSGTSQTLSVTYQRLPTEAVADHYDVLIEGQTYGVAASALATPSADDTPVAGLPVTVSTQLFDGRGRGLAGQPLVLLSRQPGRAPTVLARSRTGRGGHAGLTAVIPKAGVLQVVYAGDTAHAAVGTGDFSFRLTPRLSVAVTPGGVLHGALPDYPGDKVAVQERVHGAWRTLRTLRTDRHGAFHLVLQTTAGQHTYRVTVAADDAHLAATSRSATFTVAR